MVNKMIKVSINIFTIDNNSIDRNINARNIKISWHKKQEFLIFVNFQIFNAGGDKNNFTKKMIIDTITPHIPNTNVIYNSKGSDPRNYKVSFEKVKTILNFEPLYSVNDGVVELINAFKLGLFLNIDSNINFHGNYKLEKKYE